MYIKGKQVLLLESLLCIEIEIAHDHDYVVLIIFNGKLFFI